MDAAYTRLINDVLAVNYWGELLTVELLAGLSRRSTASPYRAIIARQLMDETRHANLTRALLLGRGRDPVREDGVAEFTYQGLFREWATRSVDEVLIFLGANERSSSRNFSSLIRIGVAAGDRPLTTIYSEILNDEVKHAANIFDRVPDTPETKATLEKANAAMKTALNMRYVNLVSAYPEAFRRTRPARRGEPAK